jgi:hypothetical protein
MNILLLDNYLASRKLEEQEQNQDVETFGDDMLEEIGAKKW